MTQNWLHILQRELTKAQSIAEVADTLAANLLRRFGADTIEISIISGNDRLRRVHQAEADKPIARPILSLEDGKCLLKGQVIKLPLFFGDTRPHTRTPELVSAVHGRGIKALTVVPVLINASLRGVIELHFRSSHQWKDADIPLLQGSARLLAEEVEKNSSTKGRGADEQPGEMAKLKRAALQVDRLIELGDVVFVKTDKELKLTELVGNTHKILGIDVHTLVEDRSIWKKIVSDRDIKDLLIVLRSASLSEEQSYEIRVVNQVTHEARWLMLRGVPVLSAEGQFVGWEGFALDITDKHLTQQELVLERKRIEALYEVSRATQVQSDPAVVTLKGIKALVRATNSDCALACFYDEAQDSIDIVAAEGFTHRSIEEMGPYLDGRSMVRFAISRKEGIIVNDIFNDKRVAAVNVLKREGMMSGMALPLLSDNVVIGAVALFSRQPMRYGLADFDLVQAALRQISLAVKQAEYYAAERRQASAVSALYHLSHEMARLMTPREMAAHAFPILQGELACKRMWLGTLNDQGSQIVGQAGAGPGVRRGVVDIQVDLSDKDTLASQLLKNREPIILGADEKFNCLGLEKIKARLDVGMIVLIPLTSLGQVVGVIILEPAVPSLAVVQRKLPLLKSMAGEMAAVMLARRFESKMAEADKMRMAGVLANGVAHNFNNLLQAIMGQASLIDMQLQENSALRESTKMILESAGKGAGLIKQLMSFSAQSSSVRRTIVINEMLKDSSDLYRSLLGSKIKFELKSTPSAPTIYADSAMIQQIVTNLLMNAKEAIGDKRDGRVFVGVSEVRVRPGEVDPELAPGIYLRIDVQDNGIGMDAERQARCFEPFYTTKDLDSRTGVGLSGAGLGLSSAYSMVKQHEGLIVVQSRIGEGSTFSVYLPALTVRSEENRDVVGGDLHPAANGKVLFVGEGEGLASEISSNLDKVGVQLVTVPTLEEARARLRLKESGFSSFVLNVDRIDPEPLPVELDEFINEFTRNDNHAKPILVTRSLEKYGQRLKSSERIELTEPVGVMGATERLIRRLLRSVEKKPAKSEGTNG